MNLLILGLWACAPGTPDSKESASATAKASPTIRWTEGHRPRTITGRTPVPSPHVSTVGGTLTLDGAETAALQLPENTTTVTVSMAATAPWSEAHSLLQQAKRSGAEQVHLVAEGAIQPIQREGSRMGRIPLHVHPLRLTAQTPALEVHLDRGIAWRGSSEGASECAQPCTSPEHWPIEETRAALSSATGPVTMHIAADTPMQVVTSCAAMLEDLTGIAPAVD